MNATPFLMFTGNAEEAINLYCSAVPGSKIENIERFEEGLVGKAGTIKKALITVAGMGLMCFDSPVKHEFGFTPSFSIFVNADDREQFDAVLKALGEDSRPLMPPGNYGFSQWFTWFQDRFGVSWQLNLP